MDLKLANHNKIQDYSEKIVRPNTICETMDDITHFKENLNNWFFSDSKENKIYSQDALIIALFNILVF